MIFHSAFFSIIDGTSYRGQNYHTNTIVIVHVATLAEVCMEEGKGEAEATQTVLRERGKYKEDRGLESVF